MRFLIDENLPVTIGDIFVNRGHVVEYAASLPGLLGESDEVVFDYAIQHDAIVVTRDVGFASIVRFPLDRLVGLVLVRFPNEITI